MPKYIFQMRRVIKPGFANDVMREVVHQAQSRQQPSNVSVSNNEPIHSGYVIISASGLDSLDQLEEMEDRLLASPDLLCRIDAIDAKCSTAQGQLLSVIDAAENVPETPKYMVRTLFKANKNQASELLNAIREHRKTNAFPIMKPLVSIPFVGQMDIVRITSIYEKLSDFELTSEQHMRVEFASTMKKIMSLTDTVTRHMSRVIYQA